MSSTIEESKNGAESAVLTLHKQFLDADQPSADLLPFVPAANRNAPMEAASPTHMVTTSLFTYLIVSYIAKPAVTDPPGLFIYR